MEKVILKEEIVVEVLNYLAKRPYLEVENLINAIRTTAEQYKGDDTATATTDAVKE